MTWKVLFRYFWKHFVYTRNKTDRLEQIGIDRCHDAFINYIIDRELLFASRILEKGRKTKSDKSKIKHSELYDGNIFYAMLSI